MKAIALYSIIFFFVFLILLLINWIASLSDRLTQIEKSGFSLTDWKILYNICNKKKWSKTSLILKMYWEQETSFKEYLLKK